MKKHLLIIAVLIAFAATVAAQKDEYIEKRYYDRISLGGQCSNHPSSFYWAGKTLMDCRVFNNTGFKLLDISAGPDYFSVSVAPLWITGTFLGSFIDCHAAVLGFYVGFLSQGQLYYPIGKHFELTAGWNLFRLTKMKDISSAWYLTGSLNAGINYFATKKLFISAYYEFNHTYNPMIKTLNWSLGGLGVDITEQPRALIGQTIGLRVGWLW